jgi:ABC-2 type transport system ATP-binding protein
MFAEQEPVLRLERVSKAFRTGFRRKTVHALRAVSLDVHSGEILAVLGHNGAGKTTLFKIVLGLLRPSGGDGSLLGRRFGDLEARREIGFQSEEPYFYPALTVRETLDLMAGLSRRPRAFLHRRTETVIEQCSLGMFLNTQVRKLSRGWLQRLALAVALLPEPKMLFLDEPLSGLDPEARLAVKELIRELRQGGTTFLISSHILPDIETLADRVALLRDGRLVACGSLDRSLGRDTRGFDVEIQGSGLVPLSTPCSRLWERPDENRTLWWFPEMDTEELQCLLRQVVTSGTAIISVAPHQENLESFFMRTMGKDAPEEMAEDSALAREAGKTAPQQRGI